MSALSVSFNSPVLAWAVPEEDIRRFRRIVQVVLVVVALFCLALLLLPHPEMPRDEMQPLPPPLAKLLLDEKKAPPLELPKPAAPEAQKPPPDAKAKDPNAPVAEWAREFDGWVANMLADSEMEDLLAWRAMAPHARRAHPTPEHLDPLFVIAGAASLYDHAVGFPVRGFEHGSVSRRCVQFGR